MAAACSIRGIASDARPVAAYNSARLFRPTAKSGWFSPSAVRTISSAWRKRGRAAAWSPISWYNTARLLQAGGVVRVVLAQRDAANLQCLAE